MERLLYGQNNDNKEWLEMHGKRHGRWANKPETHLLDDFHALMEYLMTDSYQKSLEYRDFHQNGDLSYTNQTHLEKIKEIWENVITHRKLKISAGKIEVIKQSTAPDASPYNGSDLSDGERAIFYFIGEALSVPQGCLVIIDEPENHLHKSILTRLWNAIEEARKDCVFVYITHSLDFANSRINSSIIWTKDYYGNSKWDYEIIDDVFLHDQLTLEILGNRQKVLLVEGSVETSIDRKLYSLLFDDFNVIALEGCSSVINHTKALNESFDFHYINVFGLIDKDRRSGEEISELKKSNIFTHNFADVENLFMLPEVIEIVCNSMFRTDYELILNEVKERTFQFLNQEADNQALLFTKNKYQRIFTNEAKKKTLTLDD